MDRYTFDENDNRLSKTSQNENNTINTNYQYDIANKLISEKDSTGNNFDYLYDDNGNLLSKSSINESGTSELIESYSYDSFNRFSSVQKKNESYSYLYDGSDRRIQKNTPETQLREFWNNGRIAFEDRTTKNGSEQVETYHSYIFDDDLIAVSSENSLTNIASTNAHGDTVKLISAETPTNAQYQYDAFGIQKLNTVSNIYNPYQYNGKYIDNETGFYYLNIRYYNPEIGRFMQEDTYHGNVQNASTLNLYNYCGSNPITYEDGTSHFWETAFDVASIAVSAYDFVKKPNLWNGICLAWDVATSKTGRVIRSIDKVHDTTKRIKILKEHIKLLSQLQK